MSTLVTCRSCKGAYGAHRDRCPACGLQKPRAASRLDREPTSPVCAECDGARAARECGDCGEFVHGKCWDAHEARHARMLIEDMEAALEEAGL